MPKRFSQNNRSQSLSYFVCLCFSFFVSFYFLLSLCASIYISFLCIICVYHDCISFYFLFLSLNVSIFSFKISANCNFYLFTFSILYSHCLHNFNLFSDLIKTQFLIFVFLISTPWCLPIVFSKFKLAFSFCPCLIVDIFFG